MSFSPTNVLPLGYSSGDDYFVLGKGKFACLTKEVLVKYTLAMAQAFINFRVHCITLLLIVVVFAFRSKYNGPGIGWMDISRMNVNLHFFFKKVRMYYWVFQTVNLLLYPIQLHSCAIITMTTIRHQSDSQSKHSVSHSGIV